MRALWARPDFRRLLVGQGVSALGDWMGTVALMALVLELTGSSAAVGGVLVLRLAPAMVAGPLAGRFTRRAGRLRTMLAMDLVRVGIVAAIPVLPFVAWVYILAFLLEVASILFLPARDAAIPDLVGDDQLETANSVVLGSSYGAIPLGAVAYALIASVLGALGLGSRWVFAAVFWLDAATFGVSYVMLRRITLVDPPPPAGAGAAPDAPPAPGGRAAEPEAVPDPTGGFLAALRIPFVRLVLPVLGAAALGIGVLFSVGIVFVQDTLGATSAEFGALIAVFGVGAGLGLVVLQRTTRTPGVTSVRLAVAVQGATIGVMSQSRAPWIANLGALAFGGASSFALAAGMSAVQRHLSGNDRVLAFTAFHVLMRVGLAVAALGAGFAVDALSPVRWPLLGEQVPTRQVLLGAGTLVAVTALGSARRLAAIGAGGPSGLSGGRAAP